MTGHPLLHTLVIWSTLQWTILFARLLLNRSNARSHCGNRYFWQTATQLAKGVGCSLIKIPPTPHPNRPAQINPLSVGHKGNGHGWVWFISHRAIMRAQLASRLPLEPYTPRASWPLYYSPPPTVPPSHLLSHTHNLSLWRRHRHKDRPESKGAD